MQSNAKAQSLINEALTHQQSGRIARAATLYESVRRKFPACFEAWCFGGAAAIQLNKPVEATILLNQAVRLNPRAGMAYMFLGTAEMQIGARNEAEQHLQQATHLNPKDAGVWLQLAQCLLLSGDVDKTWSAYQRCVTLNPNCADAWTGMGSLRHLQARATEAIELHTHALSLNPQNPLALAARAQSYQLRGQTTKALADYTAHLAKQPDDIDTLSQRLMLLHYLPNLSAEELFAEHRAFGENVRRAGKKPAVFSSGDPDKKLRVAFLSPDLRNHSVAFFLEPLLRHLDKSQFEIILYHNHPSVDAISDRLRSHAILWRNFVGQAADPVETAIRADAPDVIFDLAGHTGFNRLALFARRLAPVQITYLGYPNTTGLDTMDYRFTDELADPAGKSDTLNTEKLVRFSSVAWTYEAPPTAPEVNALPADTVGHVTFGCFNSLAKLNTPTLQLWALLLEAIPGARLVLKTLGLSPEIFTENLLAAGLDPQRVDLLPPAPNVIEHLRCYGRIDIALDPFPYHGTTTTCEALWMGVPVVTLSGDRHSSRVGVSLLRAVGHHELIANTNTDYIAIAKNLATDTTRLRELRQRLRADMIASPLMDYPDQAARFGGAIRTCWRNFCGKQK